MNERALNARGSFIGGGAATGEAHRRVRYHLPPMHHGRDCDVQPTDATCVPWVRITIWLVAAKLASRIQDAMRADGSFSTWDLVPWVLLLFGVAGWQFFADRARCQRPTGGSLRLPRATAVNRRAA